MKKRQWLDVGVYVMKRRVSVLLVALGLFSAAGVPTADAQPTAPAIVSTAQKLGDWKRAETEHFIFYSDGSEKELRSDAIKLERFDRMMRMVMGAPDDKGQVRLSVYFVKSAAKVQSLYPGPVKRIGGFYAPSPAGAVAVVPRIIEGYGDGIRGAAQTEDVVLFHEYAHHLMKQYYPAAYPAWYVEGFAEYVSNARINQDGTATYGMTNIGRAPNFALGPVMPIERLISARVTELKASEVGIFYARSWLLTHYLSLGKSRSGELTKYLAALQKGTASLPAAQQAFGDQKLLDKELNGYLNGKMFQIAMNKPLPPPAEFSIASLDEGASEAVLLQLKLTRSTLPAEREPIAAELRGLSARFPGNVAILTALAEAELDLGNHDAAGRAADAAVTIAPTNGRALLWKGLSLARPLAKAKDRDAAKWKTARSWIVKANRANPEDPLPLMEYFLSFAIPGQTPPEVAIQGIGKAVTLIPQFPGTRMMYSSALANQKKFDEAIRILEPISNDPHGGSLSEFVRKRIAALERAKSGDLAPELELQIDLPEIG